jgi:membrane-associated protease RseP (regulator of RpoE activity)
MKEKSYIPNLRKINGNLIIRVFPRPIIKRSRWEINLALFLATLVSISYSGWLANSNPVLNELQGGTNVALQTIIFASAIFAIIGLHEFGHLIVSILRGKEVTLPYFIPGLPPLGTFGAVILQKEPHTNRDEMFDVGASGPIVGFFISVIIAIIGLQRGFSFVVTEEQLKYFAQKYQASFMPINLPLIMNFLISLVYGRPGGLMLYVGPIAETAYVGLLITFINLLPAWQLDGGWISLSVFGEKWHRILSWISIIVMIFLGYWLMALLILFGMGRSGKVGPLDDVSPLSRSRKAFAALLLAILILCVAL